MKKHKPLVLILIVFSYTLSAQDSLKIMYYNLLNFPGTTPERVDYFRTITQYTQPDILLVNELNDEEGADLLLNDGLNVYGEEKFKRAVFTDGESNENMMFYDTTKVLLHSQDTIPTELRLINEYLVYCKGTDSVFLQLYSAHLKASSGSINEQKRLAEVAEYMNWMESKPDAKNIFFGGDLNFYDSSEPAYDTLVKYGDYPLNDPLEAGDWHDDSLFKDIHTQSTRFDQFGGGASGGLDDRFDFILFSDDVNTGENGVNYIPNSYKAIGNDGKHFDMAITDPPDNLSVPDSVLQALYYLSDHLPVVCEIQIATDGNYSVVQDGNEYKFIEEDHHFMTLINHEGTFNFRPHPGYDINGWGSSWYAQPFLPEAELKHSIVDTVIATSQGVQVLGNGYVSQDTSSTYGTWEINMVFSYDHDNKKIVGSGEYSITTDDQLDSITGDLNLYKIASNYLINVPLFCSTISGNTGDLNQIIVEGTGEQYPYTWIPADGDTFPYDMTDYLSIELTEEYNNVNTFAQGYGFYLEPTLKPSLKVGLISQQEGMEMISGLMYEESQSTDFNADNVGATALILNQSEKTNFMFDVEFESIVSAEQVSKPYFYPADTSFDSQFYASVFSDTPDVDIYYTNDGSEPKVSSFLYSDSIMISFTQTIKAKAYKCGFEVSEVSTVNYEEVLGLEDLDFGTTTVYPNPVSNKLFLNQEAQELSIYNQIGQRVLYKTEISSVDVTGLDPGLYIVEVVTVNGKKREKMVVR